jgi:hypothetical protein
LFSHCQDTKIKIIELTVGARFDAMSKSEMSNGKISTEKMTENVKLILPPPLTAALQGLGVHC